MPNHCKCCRIAYFVEFDIMLKSLLRWCTHDSIKMLLYHDKTTTTEQQQHENNNMSYFPLWESRCNKSQHQESMVTKE